MHDDHEHAPGVIVLDGDAAERFGVALDAWPRIRRVADLAAAHPAFRQAHPANQPDTPAA